MEQCGLDPMCDHLTTSNRELEAFSYRAAHDLKTPLNAVRGFAFMLIARYSDVMPEEGRKLLRYIDRSAADMEDLINGLLALSSVGHKTMQMEPVDLSCMAQDVWRELDVHRPLESDCVLIEPDLQATGDRGLVRSLLLNVLGNAKKYTADRAQPRIAFERVGTARGPAFCVHDNGVGFAAAEVEQQLFAPFARFHESSRFQGHGLGLATCMRIVRQHQGDIWLHSQPDHGTSVYFTLGSTQ